MAFNNAILLKHKDFISKLLLKSDKLSKEEKKDLLINTTTYSIRKGLVKDLFSVVKSKVDNIINDIQPSFYLKSIKKI